MGELRLMFVGVCCLFHEGHVIKQHIHTVSFSCNAVVFLRHDLSSHSLQIKLSLATKINNDLGVA